MVFIDIPEQLCNGHVISNLDVELRLVPNRGSVLRLSSGLRKSFPPNSGEIAN